MLGPNVVDLLELLQIDDLLSFKVKHQNSDQLVVETVQIQLLDKNDAFFSEYRLDEFVLEKAELSEQNDVILEQAEIDLACLQFGYLVDP